MKITKAIVARFCSFFPSFYPCESFSKPFLSFDVIFELDFCLENVRGLHVAESCVYFGKTATGLQEAKELIEAGFTYITEMDNTKIFRKQRTSYLGP